MRPNVTRGTWVAAALLVMGSAIGCAPGLSDPDRFTDESLCDFDVQQDLLARRCGVDGCHVPFEPRAGLDFVSGGLAERIVDVPASTCSSRRIVDARDPDRSFLLTRVSPDPRCGSEPIERMPLLGNLLSEREIECVRRWIDVLVDAPRRDAGAPRDAGPPMDAGLDAGTDAGPPVLVEIEAETMTLEGYMIDATDPNIIRLDETLPVGTTGTAIAPFPGVGGTYALTVHVIAEFDGAPTLALLIEGEMLFTVALPQTPTMNEPRTLGPFAVPLRRGDQIEIRGIADTNTTGAWARVDKLVFVP